MTAWTDQEIRTLRQNMHFTPSGIQSVIPGRTAKSIAHQRAHIMKNPVKFKLTWRERSAVYASFIKRGWSVMNTNLYIQACAGDVNALDTLKQRGLWNMKCEGVMK